MNENYNIMDRTIDDEPTGLLYEPTSKKIEDYLEKWFRQKNVAGFKSARVFPAREEGQLRIAVYAFFEPESVAKMRKTNSGDNIAPMFEGKVDDGSSGNTQLSKELYESLRPLCSGEKITYSVKSPSGKGGKGNKMACFQLDIFNILAMAYSVRRGREEIIIDRVEVVDNKTHNLKLTVAKKLKAYGNRRNDDVYEQIYAESLAKHR